MADKYNPNFPQSIGMEWPATRGGTEVVDHTREVGPQVISTTTGPVTGVAFDFTRAVQPPSGFKQHVLMNVYPSLAAITGVGIVDSVVRGVFTGTTTGALSGGASTVIEALESPSDTEFIALDAAEQARLRFAIDLTGKRILKVQIDVLFNGNQAAVNTSGLTMRFVDAAGAALGTDICKMDVNQLNTSGDQQTRTFTLSELDINTVDTSAGVFPKPWLDTTTDLMETTACQLELSHTFGGTAGAVVNLLYVACRVYFCDETRAAAAGYEVHPSPLTDFTAEPVFVTPGGAAWQKQAGQTYYVTTRVGFPQGPVLNYEPLFSNFTNWAPLTMYWLAADEDPPMASYVFKRDPVTAVPTTGERVTRVHQAIFDEPTADVDSISYITLHPFTVTATGTGLGTAGTATQEIISSGLPGLSYTTCRFLARLFGSPPSLDVSVDGFLRGTLTRSLFDTFEERDDGWRLVLVPLSPAVTGAATVNYKLASNRASAGDSWQVLGYESRNTFNSRVGTYGSESINATEGITARAFADLYTVLSTSAPQATGFSAIVQTQTLSPPTGCSPLDAGCVCAQDAAVTSLEYVALDWTSTAITGFGYYEMQRWDCFDDWQTIQTLTDAVTGSAFADYGARIDVETKYRVRICRADGICGAWSTEQTVTLAKPSIPAYYFTSNASPEFNLAYPDVGASAREYTFPDADEVVVQRLYGRDDQVVFRPTERRGDDFTRTLLLHSCATHPKPSMVVFKPLRDLSESPILPFLVVRDTRGNRWNASLIVPRGTERGRRTSNVFISEVRVIEVLA